MSRNIYSQNDIVYVMQPTRNLMLAIGVWPSENEEISLFRKIYNLFLNFSTNFLLACDFIPGGIYWLLEKSVRVRLQMSPLLLYVIMASFQYDVLLFRNSRIRQCWKHVEEDWKNVLSMDARNVMFKCAKSARFLIFICASLMYSGAFMYHIIMPLSQKKIVNDQNVTIRPLACPVNYLFIDTQVSPLYEILFISQSIAGILMVSIPTCAYCLIATFMEHANGQMKILICLMKNLVQNKWEKENEIDKKIARVVEHQIRVHNFVQMVQYTLQEICLVEIMANTFPICLVLYFIVLVCMSFY
ncbi:uncharacterized protein LOC116852922 [Odontomachus brunneus]|uniref:uncharacterized protein LOC116852922 n=1 Tax=Odontomachus brunneus TaxID=486640 RepID=UPI0013F1F142|nr:uncharacterized protein LOC116852922 [Odontomachus brunneus]